MGDPTIIETVLVLMVGLCFGSFATLVSYRLPLGQDIVAKPSCCPKCATKLGFSDLWPVGSWVAARGKCRHCAAPISARYPLIELTMAAIFLLLYMIYGLTAPGIILMLMAAALLIMIVVDFEHYIIPDEIHFVLVPLAIAYHYFIGSDVKYVLYGLALGGGIGLALHYGYRHLRKKEGLGFGDVKFFAVAGLWLGLQPIVPFLFFSGLFGVATGMLWKLLRRGELFPFGPALAVSLFMCVAFPEIPNLFWNMGEYIK